jgi:hypothetical protein
MATMTLNSKSGTAATGLCRKIGLTYTTMRRPRFSKKRGRLKKKMKNENAKNLQTTSSISKYWPMSGPLAQSCFT